MKLNRLVPSITLMALLCASVVTAQEKPADPEKLGQVHFPVSCSVAAQQQFERAVTMLHSFFYPETVKAFTAVTETDPQCAMAYWGIAISQRPNPLVGPYDAATLKRGLDAVEKAKSIGAKTQRERDYIAAIELFFKDSDKLDQSTRVLAYEKAMEQVYLRYPEDREAAVFYALALNETALPSDKTYANQLKAAAILEKVDAEQPNHPGVAHYIIHSYDYSPLATRGLPAANKYAKIAPSAPHALHMPSHIYSMLGYWEESIQSNRAALTVAKDYAAKNWPGASDPTQLHCLDFMEYAYLQGAQDRQAKVVLDERHAIQKVAVERLTGDTALAAIPARYMLERGAWSEAAALEPRPSRSAQAEAITYFARALGFARSGDTANARKDIEKLRMRRDSLVQAKQTFWAGQTEVQIRAASAWVARAEGKNAEALQLMRSAADLEDSSEKHVAMENRLLPMRELLGDLLLELKEPAQGLREFEASLKVAPNRFRGFYGAAKAAELSGDREKARAFYAKLVALCSHADSERPELLEAKAFVAKK